ncbi:MAG: hypothetical protein JWN78_620 [Bacteroidota bacterium]|nr:hypothetical protein [Bacteroidota bacterium]
MRFYCKNISSICVLTGDQATHCTKVLRYKTNDIVELMNGKGELASAKITGFSKTEVFLKIEKVLKHISQNPNKLSVAICLTKNPARIEWFLEKATEIGIQNIYPLTSHRTEKATMKEDRFQQILISAARQSGQLHFPELHPVQKFNSFIQQSSSQQKFIAYCEDEKKHLMEVYKKNEPALLLIGPEGDFTKEEVELAVNNNYIPVSLGNSILRVETAGVVACSIVNAINFKSDGQ